MSSGLEGTNRPGHRQTTQLCVTLAPRFLEHQLPAAFDIVVDLAQLLFGNRVPVG
jgi:hypothetical protein